MKYVTRTEFEQRFPRKESDAQIDTIFPGSLTLDQDATINGIVRGDVTVKSGVQAIITGVVNGSVHAEDGSLIFLYGIVGGDVWLAGNALVTGLVKGKTTGTEDACVYVP